MSSRLTPNDPASATIPSSFLLTSIALIPLTCFVKTGLEDLETDIIRILNDVVKPFESPNIGCIEGSQMTKQTLFGVHSEDLDVSRRQSGTNSN
ncbi:hypothetical protein OGAPHI_004322 [Ogataea philodendri]|uniref:Uncharacterized protein n=1 Tax=Ogataea philodendri TaxID=1378263 RepID=A0A9P8P5Z4_9ASCO|nr:uncharacterized protein OGAPHI_004322 [Ogataea philodendri]KAH3666133.1 hypothetical protein OGAPHI_004322 [Ogataea philodendri]